MAKKTPVPVTLDDLKKAPDLDALEPLPGLLAEVERLAGEIVTVDRERDKLLADRHSFSPYKLGQLEERYTPLTEALTLARQRVDAERARLQIEIDSLFVPLLTDAVAKLVKALEPAAQRDAELHDLETLRTRFVPFAGRIRLRSSADDLRALSRYVEQQRQRH